MTPVETNPQHTYQQQHLSCRPLFYFTKSDAYLFILPRTKPVSWHKAIYSAFIHTSSFYIFFCCKSKNSESDVHVKEWPPKPWKYSNQIQIDTSFSFYTVCSRWTLAADGKACQFSALFFTTMVLDVGAAKLASWSSSGRRRIWIFFFFSLVRLGFVLALVVLCWWWWCTTVCVVIPPYRFLADWMVDWLRTIPY